LNSGAFSGYGEPGFQFCWWWFEAKYLVSSQDFVYESPNNRVLTRDNLNVEISLSLLLKIVPENDYVL